MKSIQFADDSVAYIGPVVSETASDFCAARGLNRLYVVTDENVRRDVPGAFPDAPVYAIPPGESSKSAQMWEALESWLVESGADRSSCVVAIGGGVVTDLAGFAAATYMRGVSWVAIATSLMAQLDAAHGGKTGIDLESGKNLVGSFHFPLAVWCDVRHLATLPERELRSGYAEAIKYGFVFDGALLDPVESSDPPLTTIVERCVELKAATVRNDPHERTGLRATLNFGHTVGHAVEAACGYEGILHGEAVMIGMIVEAEIGKRLGMTSPQIGARLKRLAEARGLPVTMPRSLSVDVLLSAMRRDKKASNGMLTMSLLEEVGSCRLVREIDESVVREALVRS